MGGAVTTLRAVDSPPGRPVRRRLRSRRGRRRPLALAALLTLLPLASLLGSCAAFRPTREPMRTLALHEAADARCLLVLLPGRHSRPEAFRRAGFAEAVAARGIAADVVAVDAHLGYYRERTVIDRLHADVLAPARDDYEAIWVAGTSLGGLGGLLLLRDHPEDVEGVLALAPFLGEDELIAEIAAAGGPRRWEPAEPPSPGDAGRQLWSLLRRVEWTSAAPLYLGWGDRDWVGPANRMLAELLPASLVFNRQGGHDLRTWRALWEDFLDRVEPCAAGGAAAGEG